MGCCELEEVYRVRSDWPTAVVLATGESATADSAVLSVTGACVRCGQVEADSRWRLSESSLFELRARRSLGRVGDWRSLLLPRFHRIGRTIGAAFNIAPTIRRRRFGETIANLSEGNLEGLIRRYMGLGVLLWPRSIVPRAWPRPIIVHHGLARKFAQKRDVDHTLLCSYVIDAIQHPTEVWLGTHMGRPRLRYLKKFSTLREHYTLLVSVDPRDSIVLTAYMIDDQQHEVNREGEFLYASWAAPE